MWPPSWGGAETRKPRQAGTRPSTWRPECPMRPDRARSSAIWTHRTGWMLSRMLSRTMSSSSVAAWPWNRACTIRCTRVLEDAAVTGLAVRKAGLRAAVKTRAARPRGSRPCSPQAPRSSRRHLDRRAPLLAAPRSRRCRPWRSRASRRARSPSGGVRVREPSPAAARCGATSARASGPRAGRPRQCLAVRRPSWGGDRPASCCRESSRSAGVANGQSGAATRVTRRIRTALSNGSRHEAHRSQSVYSTPRISSSTMVTSAETSSEPRQPRRLEKNKNTIAPLVVEGQVEGGTRRRACSACWPRQMQEPGWIGRFQDCTRHSRRGVCLAAVLNGNSRQGRASNQVVRSSTSAGSGTRRPHSCGRLGFRPASIRSRSEEDFK